MIIKKVFGTTSKTEIEKMDHTELNWHRQELEELFEELKNSKNPVELLGAA